VQDDGHRHRQACDQLEDVVAVAAAEDAELVLDDDRVEAPRTSAAAASESRAADPLRDDAAGRRGCGSSTQRTMPVSAVDESSRRAPR
jgi:hypothetical protein